MTQGKKEQNVIKYTLINILFFGLITHGFFWFNTLYSHDSLCSLYQDDDIWEIMLGRFIQPIYLEYVRGRICSPLLLSFFALLWIAITIFLVLSIFGITSKALISIICGVIITNIAMITTNATYCPWSDIFMLSFMFGMMATYCFKKYKHGYLIGVIPLVISLGIYQSYLQTVIIVLLLIIVQNIFEGHSWKQVLNCGIKALLMLGTAVIVYYCLNQVIVHFYNITLTEYRGLDKMGDFSDINILSLIQKTYLLSIRNLFNLETYQSSAIECINGLIVTFNLISGIYILKEKKVDLINKVFWIIITIFLLPLGANSIYFISKGIENSTLSMMSFIYLYLYAVICVINLKNIVEEKRSEGVKSKSIKYFIYVFMFTFLLVFKNNVIYSNQVYLKKNLDYQATAMVLNRIVDRIEQFDNYIVGKTQVAFIGDLNKSPLYQQRTGYENITATGIWSNNYSTTYMGSMHGYFKYVLSYPIYIASDEIIEKYSNNEIVNEMSPFPAANSCGFVDGIFVVKLSD